MKEEKFTILNAASEEMIGEMMSVLNVIEPISSMESITKASLKGLPLLTKFISLHCTERKYSFQVKKCGDAACNICKPPNLPRDIFSQLKWIPDPIPDSDGHYKQFSSLYRTKTSEDYCPSLKQKTSVGRHFHLLQALGM